MAQFIELEIDQGTTFNVDLDLSEANSTPINVSGYIFTSSIRKSYYSSRVTANLVVSVTNASNGNVSLSLAAANTANIKAGRYLFDIKQVDPQNTVTRLVEGIITVNPQVTK
jgi:hypothetical protein